MKIKTLTQRGKYTLLAGVLGMSSIPSSAIPTGMADVSLPTVAQQTAKIKGKVLDARTGEPVIGANVVVKGTTNGSITNFDGEYELTAPIGSTLSISFIGYKSIEVKATGGLQTIKLDEDSEALDEVIVVGYTTQRKESLTGSMNNIKSEKLKDITTPSVENLLNTRVRDNILKSKEQKNIQPTKGGHKMVTCQNYVSLFYRQITSCPSDGGIS